MSFALNRRSVLQATVAAVLGWQMPARAQGRILFGFQLFPEQSATQEAVLKELQGHYPHNLGLKPTVMAGNSGMLAMEAAHAAPADGSTALFSPSSLMSLQPLLRKSAKVDPVRDFVAVDAVAEFAFALVLGAGVPAEVATLADYAQWVKAHPMSLACGSLGEASIPRLLVAELSEFSGSPLQATEYRSVVSLVQDLQSGSLPVGVMPIMALRFALRDPRLRLIAVSSERRWPGLPATPTLREAGVSAFGMADSLGVFLPARCPPEMVNALRTALRAAAQSPNVKGQVLAAGMQPMPPDAPDFAAVLVADRQRWAQVLQKLQPALERPASAVQWRGSDA